MKLSPQEHFLRIAWLVALNLSKDPHTKVGAVITTPDYRQLSTGYNGFPKGVVENDQRWSSPEKYEYVVHSECNAIINCPFDTKNCIIFVTHEPCHRCLGLLLNAGISEITYSEKCDSNDQQRIKELSQWFKVYRQYKVDPSFLAGLKSLF